MKKFFKALVVTLSCALVFTLFAPVTVQAATKKKEGTYAVEGYMIKGVSKSDNKLKVVTNKSHQMTILSDEHITYLKGKTFTFVLDKNVTYQFMYYTSDNVKESSLKEIKKGIKVSKLYSKEYTLAEETVEDMTVDDFPRLYIVVNKKGKVTNVIYEEGEFDTLHYMYE